MWWCNNKNVQILIKNALETSIVTNMLWSWHCVSSYYSSSPLITHDCRLQLCNYLELWSQEDCHLLPSSTTIMCFGYCRRYKSEKCFSIISTLFTKVNNSAESYHLVVDCNTPNPLSTFLGMGHQNFAFLHHLKSSYRGLHHLLLVKRFQTTVAMLKSEL